MPPLRLSEYELGPAWGRGASGIVFRAVHEPTGVQCAVKVLHAKRALDPETQRSFQRELRAAAGLRHPHIIRIHDHGVVDPAAAAASAGVLAAGSPFVVLDAFPGGDLDRWRGRLPWGVLRGFVRDVLAGLAHAHARGVLHRDLKPSNLLLDRPADEPRARVALADFGIARVLDPGGAATNEEDYLGTPKYSPPEQMFGLPVDQGPWTDLYALGCTVWALACKRAPYGGRSMAAVVAAHDRGELPAFEPLVSMPIGVEAWLQRALRRDIDERFATAAEATAAWLALDSAPLPTLHSNEATTPLVVSTRMFGRREPAVVGRVAEQTALTEALERVTRNGCPEAVLLRGGAGTGKSRLAQWICRQAEVHGSARVLTVRHSRQAGPGHGFGPALGRLFRTQGREPDAARHRLRAALTKLELTDEAEVGLTMETLRPGSLIPPPRGSERRAVLRAVLAALAEAKPLVIWLDDLHFAPQAAGVISKLPPDAPILLVATLRDDLLRAGRAVSNCLSVLADRVPTTQLPVGALDDGAARRLIEEILFVRGDLAERIAERAGGNPLFATQLVSDLVARGALLASRDGYVATPLAEGRLPADLRRLWLDRADNALAGRSPTWRHGLELAAALGDSVDLREWAAACEAAGIEMPVFVVDALVETGLAVPTPDGFAFAHSLAREAVEERARDEGRWPALCSAAGDALLSGSPPQHRRAARLLLEAHRPKDALTLCMDGADLAARAGEHEAADDLLELGAACLDRLQAGPEDPRQLALVLLRAECVRLRSRFADARQVVEGLPARADAAGQSLLAARARHLLGVLMRMTGEPLAAERPLEVAIAAFSELDAPVEHADALLSLAQLAQQLEGSDAVLPLLDRAQQLLPPPPAARAVRRRLLRLQCRALEESDPAGSLAALMEAIALSREDLELHAEARLQMHLAHANRLRGNHKESLAAARRMLELARRAGHAGDIGDARSTLGDVLAAANRFDEAEGWYQRSIVQCRKSGTPWIAVPLANLGRMRLIQGRFDEAQALLVESHHWFTEINTPPAVNLAAALLVRAEVGRGDWASAGSRTDELAAAPASIEDRPEAAEFLDAASRAAARAGQRELAQKIRAVMARLALDGHEPTTIKLRR